MKGKAIKVTTKNTPYSREGVRKSTVVRGKDRGCGRGGKTDRDREIQDCQQGTTISLRGSPSTTRMPPKPPPTPSTTRLTGQSVIALKFRDVGQAFTKSTLNTQ